MNDKMEQMTSTEKRYSKHIGKLYWCGERTYNSDIEGYKYYYNLVMVGSMVKNRNKRYSYDIEVLHSPYQFYGDRTYKVECSFFLTMIGSINKWGNGYFPSTGDLEKDVAQIHKAC